MGKELGKEMLKEMGKSQNIFNRWFLTTSCF